MKNSKHLIHRSFAFLLFSTTIILASCKGDPKTKEAALGASMPDFSMNCVILSKAQVQAWVDSGWTRPTDPGRIKTLLFQFYTPDGAGAASNMTLLTYPGTTWSNVKVSGRTNLTIDTTCVPLKLAGKTILANNVADLKSLKIFNTDGTLNDFDFIRFRPVKVDGEYISFAIEVVKVVAEKETYLAKGDTYPCPPHCPPTGPEEQEE